MSNNLVFEGHTTVDGVTVQVTLVIDNIALIHALGAKAALSKGGKATEAGGLVYARVAAHDRESVKIARAEKRAKNKALAAKQHPELYPDADTTNETIYSLVD